MTLNPSAQKRAQEEIDRVVGTERLPNFDDRASLPYVEALLRETLRWRVAVPLAAPHTTADDDMYNGLYFPKGKFLSCIFDVVVHSFKPRFNCDGKRLVKSYLYVTYDNL